MRPRSRPAATVAWGAVIMALGLGAVRWARSDPPAAPDTAAPAAAMVVDAARYPTLQAALDAVPAAGGLVKLPPGDFRIDAPLVLTRSNTRVVGAGPATCLINCNTQGQPALVVRPADLDQNPKATIWRVQVANFRIVGDPDYVDAKSTTPKSGSGIVAQHVNEIYIHGMSIDHNGGHGIDLVHCYEDPRVADSILTYNGRAGLNIDAGHDIVVSANQFEENQDAVRCSDSFNLCLTGNNIDDHRRDGVVIENTYGSVLAGNMIEECQGRAIVLDRDCYGITISANVLADNFGGGVDLRDAWGCTVSANTFTIVAVRALVVGPESGRITITGNNFSDSYIGAETKRAGQPNLATGVLLNGTCDVVVSGNVFSGLTGEAITVDPACQRLLLVKNLVRETEESAGSEEKGTKR